MPEALGRKRESDSSMPHGLPRQLKAAVAAYKEFFSHRTILQRLVSIFMVQFHTDTIDVLLPHMSIRFGWTLSKVIIAYLYLSLC